MAGLQGLGLDTELMDRLKAEAQAGRLSADRASHGHSLIIDPWGLVVAQAGDQPTVLVADCPTEEIDRVRAEIPALSNRRLKSPDA